MIREKQGSSAVFLAVILAALVTVTLTMVFAGRAQARISIADGALHLASASLLSEYDYYIQRDYGLFLLQGTDAQLSASLRDYTGYSAKASAARFSTAAIESVNEQILDYMKGGGIVRGSGVVGGDGVMSSDEDTGGGGDADSGLASGDTASGSAAPDRTLRHGPTIVSLPSRSMPDSDLLTTAQKLGENLTNPEAIFRTGSNKFFLTEYILQKFNYAEAYHAADHFFNSEVEYILCGEFSDAKNRKQTDLALEAVRAGLNLTHIYSDPQKMEAIAAAAETITPGPMGLVTQFGIAAAWAAAEAVNDVKLLHNGCNVPIVKTSASWALELDAILEGYQGEDGCVHPQIDTGRAYDDYLRILLYAKDDTMKTARIMDLIQINMRKNYDGNFLIQECATGVSIDAEVYGRKLSYDRIY